MNGRCMAPSPFKQFYFNKTTFSNRKLSDACSSFIFVFSLKSLFAENVNFEWKRCSFFSRNTIYVIIPETWLLKFFFCRGIRFRLSCMFLLNTLQFTADQVESPRTIIACVICYKNIEEGKIFLLNWKGMVKTEWNNNKNVRKQIKCFIWFYNEHF